MASIRIFYAGLIAGLMVMSRVEAAQPADVVSSDNAGNTAMGTSAMLNLTVGNSNTAGGFDSLYSLTSGLSNTAFGANSLSSVTDAGANAAFGYQALSLNVGAGNTAIGSNAMSRNTTGTSNTAVGYESLANSDDGSANVSVGQGAMYLNRGGSYNVASGYQALFSNSTGHQNGAMGSQALLLNTTGSDNIAIGANSLRVNTTGGNNVGVGVATLQNMWAGQNNTAVGTNAMTRNGTGSGNTAIGANAGFNITGKNNIDIANEGQTSDSGIIRIGDTQTGTFVAGISTSQVTGAAVYVSSSGQLGVLPSSERYKTAIEPIAAESDRLSALRPVTYRLKNDPAGGRQYGLIAEEVAKIYPDLVFRNAQGGIEGVRYEELTPLLLNEIQEQRKDVLQQQQEVRRLSAEFTALKQQLAEVTAAMNAGRAPAAQR